jgi:hypothetical protein
VQTWTCYGTATIEMAGTVTPQGNPVSPVTNLSVDGYDFANLADCQNIQNYTKKNMLSTAYNIPRTEKFNFTTTPPNQPALSCTAGDFYNGQTTLTYSDGTNITYGLDKKSCCQCNKFGACNVPGNSQCVVETPAACAAAGGTYLGDGAVCNAPNTPALPLVPAAALGAGVVVGGIRKLRHRRTLRQPLASSDGSPR